MGFQNMPDVEGDKAVFDHLRNGEGIQIPPPPTPGCGTGNAEITGPLVGAQGRVARQRPNRLLPR